VKTHLIAFSRITIAFFRGLSFPILWNSAKRISAPLLPDRSVNRFPFDFVVSPLQNRIRMAIAPHVRGGSMSNKLIDQKMISKLFFESESHDVLMDSLQSDTIAHTSGGMAQLITPEGKRDRVVTQWYAMHWCKDHRDWTWEAL
jgi:hypothetical protein